MRAEDVKIGDIIRRVDGQHADCVVWKIQNDRVRVKWMEESGEETGTFPHRMLNGAIEDNVWIVIRQTDLPEDLFKI